MGTIATAAIAALPRVGAVQGNRSNACTITPPIRAFAIGTGSSRRSTKNNAISAASPIACAAHADPPPTTRTNAPTAKRGGRCRGGRQGGAARERRGEEMIGDRVTRRGARSERAADGARPQPLPLLKSALRPPSPPVHATGEFWGYAQRPPGAIRGPLRAGANVENVSLRATEWEVATRWFSDQRVRRSVLLRRTVIAIQRNGIRTLTHFELAHECRDVTADRDRRDEQRSPRCRSSCTRRRGARESPTRARSGAPSSPTPCGDADHATGGSRVTSAGVTVGAITASPSATARTASAICSVGMPFSK